jgi:segregation and condensation protein A
LTGNIIKISEDLRGYGTQPFEGPLDLLLYLINQDEIDIYDIPIAEITHQYLSYLEAMKELDLEVAGEFILMASMLIRIKVQMLLPQIRVDETEFEDPRSELVAALLEYKKFKQASEDLGSRGEIWLKRYSKGEDTRAIDSEVNYVLRKVDITALMIAFGEVLSRAKSQSFHQVSGEEIYIEDRIKYIATCLTSEGAEFSELFADDPRRIVMVATFIAVLELARIGQIKLKQHSMFSRLWVYPTDLNIEEAIRKYAESR